MVRISAVSATKKKAGEPKAKASKPLKGHVFINEDRCKGCAFCVAFCPVHCLVMSKRINFKGYLLPEMALPEKCTGCNMCGLYCPDFAIFGERIVNKGEERKK